MKRVHTFRGVVMDRPVKAQPKPVPAGPAKIRVSRETSGRGGRGVTVITGLPLRGAELEELAGRLKRSCGAGAACRATGSRSRGSTATASWPSWRSWATMPSGPEADARSTGRWA